MKLWCFDDAHNWGQMLGKIAAERGHDVHLFDDPRKPDDGYVFMHMHHHPSVRMLHKRCMSIMAMHPDLTLIPNYQASVLFDDKLEQARSFPRWMPRTRVFYTPGAARRFLDQSPALPMISKSSDGAASHNVRMVATFDEAKLEIKQSFSDLGIKCRHGQTQRGYLLWQDFIPDALGDLRIIAVGTKRLILQRNNRLDRPTQPSALVPINDLDDPDIAAALATANEFFKAEGFKWAGLDLIRQPNGLWVILEMTVSWTLHGYYECNFLDCSGDAPKVMATKGDQIWSVLVDELEAGSFA